MERIKTFITSEKQIFKVSELANVLSEIATEAENRAKSKRLGTSYASHVTEERKEQIYQKELILAEEIRQGEHLHCFWLWQRVNTKITGQCVALLPK